MERKYVLDAAHDLIYGERNEQYGDPVENHTNIGLIWGGILGTDPIPAAVVAAMMAGVKLARIGYTPNHEDSWIDLAAYAAIGGEASEFFCDCGHEHE